ncbi:C-glycoside deglycosidase beta subunit domain-containing protein [Alteromonas sp. RKMC-009]|uniref:C-glycoside deglycosidase beta subunit domain-containing protein n=1 Tax=Alteromonas sp. RKMC-009 TaxID=2267264 RepID=UPI000E6A6713|nr:DUF6379 domain-containing protein [Alteromonas sp. RKMC-009]AYA62651.1 hypothetical protein DS731_00780 [Alteromonas sp. RKMC-009]
MFDNKVIVENSLTRVTSAEAGFDGVSVLARLPYYRGLGLSMVENIAVTVDDKIVAREDTLFSVRGNTWTLDEMETEYGERWNFGEKAKVLVKLPEGLDDGEHDISVAITMRVSYLPFVPTTKDTKRLALQG